MSNNTEVWYTVMKWDKAAQRYSLAKNRHRAPKMYKDLATAKAQARVAGDRVVPVTVDPSMCVFERGAWQAQ